MSRKRKKIVKLRGSRTCGWGSAKKHRGAGSRGGRGLAGTKKHRKFWVMKNMPEHIGKRGFKSLTQRKLKQALKTINLRDIVKLTDKKDIDLIKLGYDKVLGAGHVEKPLKIRARFFTKTAEEKIIKAGGRVIKQESEK